MRVSIMTLVFCALTLFTTASQPASADTLEVFFRSEQGEVHLAGVDLFIAGPLRGKFGLSGFALVVPGWAQVYAGPTYAPAKWLELSVSAGVEQVGSDLGLRLAASAWAGHKKWSVLAIAEGNPQSFTGDASGVWFDLTPMYELTPRLTIGAKWRRGVGAGPLVQLSSPTKPSVKIWISWMPVEPEQLAGHGSRFLLGVQAKI